MAKSLYNFLSFVLIFLLLKYVYDFIVLDLELSFNSQVIVNDNTILRPRLQITDKDNNFTYITATSGIILEDTYHFYEITLTNQKASGTANEGFYEKKDNYIRLKGDINFDFK
ncbi:MAG: hypothetical protein Ta2D_09340 [Rickettsiales bacterium]|nr:MAG: hypothetical protein Ta2D_09340 [Rickettsiales bacterium]